MIQNLISMMFYILFIIYAMFGTYSLALNKEARLNQVFTCLCCCFSIWGFTFALVNSAVTYEEALIWRRISVLGWGVAYSIMLHFFIILTESKWSQKEKQPILLLTLYGPSALIIFFFGLCGTTANEQIILLKTVTGWITVSSNNGLEKLFYLYYLSFSLISLIMLIQWYRNSTEQNKKNQARYLLLAFCSSVFLGSFTDAIANNYLQTKLPSLAPVIIMISVATIYYIIKKYGLMLAPQNTNENAEGIILNTNGRTRLFRYVGMILVMGSGINFFILLIRPNERFFAAILCFSLVAIGAFVTLIPYLIQSIKNQERLMTVLIVIIISVVMLFFADAPFSNIIWPGPIFFIILTTVFNNRKMFYITAILTILMGIFLWIKFPYYSTPIGISIYSLRLLLYIIGICLTAAIRKVYRERLEANAKLEAFQKLISELSTDFVTISVFDFDAKVEDLITRSGKFLNADRASIGMYANEWQVKYTHEWISEGAEGVKNIHSSIPHSSNIQLLENKIVKISGVQPLFMIPRIKNIQIRKQGVYAQICIPIPGKNGVIGFIRFDRITRRKNWQIDDHEMLRLLANILADAIAKVETEKEISYLAYYDPLTGLPNRVLFYRYLEQAIELAKQRKNLLGVIFIDIDGFKEVNDTIGHDWGDYLINEIGRRLLGCIQKDNIVARFGGDEFLIMSPDVTGKGEMDKIAEQIMGVFDLPVMVNEQQFFITASGGVAIFPEDGETVNGLIKNADLAMYAAKNKGKGQYLFCSSEMKEMVMKKANLAQNLYQAIEKDELILYYQPQVEIISQEIIGFEALVRWNHPELGIVSPGIFIPIAEQTGLINSIGEWVMMTACAQNKAWQDQGFKPVQMAVNLSLEQFRSENVENIVKKCLHKTGLEPQYLELEITEGIAMKESQYVIECLHNLKKMGVAISIDDFGTEFSSLSRLKVLPVDRLKIDMQFIRGIGINTRDESIIAVMIHLAKRLGLKVIAEGVETGAQKNFLKNENCDEIQGYYYYKPMSSEAIEAEIFNA
ncbi:EAL domain-containing protein [Acetobacterium woodii]|uniref:Uncharacterized protein n=1 Tax=Acetobacterium woodii (strain ATCC 29683 / DSM 1030 / JCM 2381 / KCTC 1655 / WB1) TaxID=931626 RepID=H6LF92_ACEWD|nr:EAL domain-containing protein [Acetobacterium woodii]AFA48192.1 hypothetical protein Awo_c14080 [Acetobacterium woodii DSM 1030]